MKIVIVSLVCLMAWAVTSEENLDKDKILTIAKECKDHHSATDDDVEAMFNQMPPKGRAAECMRHCVMKNLNLLDENDRLNSDTTEEMLKGLTGGDVKKKEEAKNISDKCKAIAVPADPCEVAAVYTKCLVDEMKDKGFGTL